MKTHDLTVQQHVLLELMSTHRFGRIEHLQIRKGQPILDTEVRIVRVARLGKGNDAVERTTADDFELKQEVCDLFEELGRLQNGKVLVEFRHGLPVQLEVVTETFSRLSGSS